jgi:hypothetical protein
MRCRLELVLNGFSRALIVSVGPMAPLILANERDGIARQLRSCLLPILANPIIVVGSGKARGA